MVDKLAALAMSLGRPKFTPSHVSNHVFLLNLAQAVAVPLVNFGGRPFALETLAATPFLAAVTPPRPCRRGRLRRVPSAPPISEVCGASDDLEGPFHPPKRRQRRQQ